MRVQCFIVSRCDVLKEQVYMFGTATREVSALNTLHFSHLRRSKNSNLVITSMLRGNRDSELFAKFSLFRPFMRCNSIGKRVNRLFGSSSTCVMKRSENKLTNEASPEVALT